MQQVGLVFCSLAAVSPVGKANQHSPASEPENQWQKNGNKPEWDQDSCAGFVRWIPQITTRKSQCFFRYPGHGFSVFKMDKLDWMNQYFHLSSCCSQNTKLPFKKLLVGFKHSSSCCTWQKKKTWPLVLTETKTCCLKSQLKQPEAFSDWVSHLFRFLLSASTFSCFGSLVLHHFPLWIVKSVCTAFWSQWDFSWYKLQAATACTPSCLLWMMNSYRPDLFGC